MAKRVIVLKRTDSNQPDQDKEFDVLYWLAVSVVARRPYYAKPVGTKSRWAGASQAENDQIVAGEVVEVLDHVKIPDSAGLPQIEAHMEAIWNRMQADLNASVEPQRYGSFWDDVGGWTITSN